MAAQQKTTNKDKKAETVLDNSMKAHNSELGLEDAFNLMVSVGDCDSEKGVIHPHELSRLLKYTAENEIELRAYDGFEPSGRRHIAQGLMRTINVNKLTKSGVTFVFYVADWFAQLNNKMGGDLAKIREVGQYFVEVWRACGMDLTRVEFVQGVDSRDRQNHDVEGDGCAPQPLRRAQSPASRQSDGSGHADSAENHFNSVRTPLWTRLRRPSIAKSRTMSSSLSMITRSRPDSRPPNAPPTRTLSTTPTSPSLSAAHISRPAGSPGPAKRSYTCGSKAGGMQTYAGRRPTCGRCSKRLRSMPGLTRTRMRNIRWFSKTEHLIKKK
eukprot:894773_1